MQEHTNISNIDDYDEQNKVIINWWWAILTRMVKKGISDEATL